MEIELNDRSIPNCPRVEFRVNYKGRLLDAYYKPDFICFGEVVVELKAPGRLTSIASIHQEEFASDGRG